MCNHPVTTRLPGYQAGDSNDMIIGNCDTCKSTVVIGEKQKSGDVLFDETQLAALVLSWPVSMLEIFGEGER